MKLVSGDRAQVPPKLLHQDLLRLLYEVVHATLPTEHQEVPEIRDMVFGDDEAAIGHGHADCRDVNLTDYNASQEEERCCVC